MVSGETSIASYNRNALGDNKKRRSVFTQGSQGSVKKDSCKGQITEGEHLDAITSR